MIVAGTGHRPDKLGGYSAQVRDRLVHTAEAWLMEHPEVDEVISGGALGWDQALAQAAINLGISTTLALPFPGFEDRWPKESKIYLHRLMALADKVVYVSDAPYAVWKMQVRNEWMVDHCDLLLALWDGSTGGTGNCISYADKVGVPIYNLWKDFK